MVAGIHRTFRWAQSSMCHFPLFYIDLYAQALGLTILEEQMPTISTMFEWQGNQKPHQVWW